MKTVEEAAREYVIVLSEDNLFGKLKEPKGAGTELLNAFKAGVEFAQQWKSVDDELPHSDGSDGAILIKYRTSRGKEKYGIATYFDVTSYVGDDPISRAMSGFTISGSCRQDVTHWRHVELK